MIRLDRFLANQGIGTRKEVKQLIRQQLVRIDGVLIERGDHKFDEERCVVTLRDEVIEHHKDVYLLFHKPAGCVCANHDPLHPTVFDHLPACYQRLSTVGRLDKDTTAEGGSIGISTIVLLVASYHLGWKKAVVAADWAASSFWAEAATSPRSSLRSSWWRRSPIFARKTEVPDGRLRIEAADSSASATRQKRSPMYRRSIRG